MGEGNSKIKETFYVKSEIGLKLSCFIEIELKYIFVSIPFIRNNGCLHPKLQKFRNLSIRTSALNLDLELELQWICNYKTTNMLFADCNYLLKVC